MELHGGEAQPVADTAIAKMTTAVVDIAGPNSTTMSPNIVLMGAAAGTSDIDPLSVILRRRARASERRGSRDPSCRASSMTS